MEGPFRSAWGGPGTPRPGDAGRPGSFPVAFCAGSLPFCVMPPAWPAWGPLLPGDGHCGGNGLQAAGLSSEVTRCPCARGPQGAGCGGQRPRDEGVT